MVSWRSGGKAYHDQKATKKPNHEKKNTRPYMLTGLNMGIDRALWLIGLTSGALKRTAAAEHLVESIDSRRPTSALKVSWAGLCTR